MVDRSSDGYWPSVKARNETVSATQLDRTRWLGLASSPALIATRATSYGIDPGRVIGVTSASGVPILPACLY